MYGDRVQQRRFDQGLVGELALDQIDGTDDEVLLDHILGEVGGVDVREQIIKGRKQTFDLGRWTALLL